MNQATSQASQKLQPTPSWQDWVIADEEERLEFLSRHFLVGATTADNLRYGIAVKTITDYDGGYWEYAVTPDGFGFVYPKVSDVDNPVIEVSNIFQDNFAKLHPVLVGIHTTRLMLLQIMMSAETLQLTDREEIRIHDHYYAMRDYGRSLAKKLDQADQFYALVD